MGNELVIKSWSAHHELRLLAHQFLSRFKMKRCVKQTLVHYIELLVTRQASCLMEHIMCDIRVILAGTESIHSKTFCIVQE